MTETREKYRADIDGLRALSVALVLIYHIDHRVIPGGFIGVDIFFVISGYVITKMIRNELVTTGTFDFVKFTAKRAQRLLPALLATILVVLALALLLYEKGQIRSTAVEAVAASLFASNVLFWLQAGYFDAASLSKPLLHTWSLAVEAQFYLFWPLLLVVGHRFADRGRIAVGAALATSLFAALLFMDSAGFFLTPFRIYEFAIGAALTFVPASRWGWARPSVGWAGLAVIVAASLVISTETPWPSGLALIPCLAAALVILSGARDQNPVLGTKLAAHIGRASYSIYLAHWPVIVFGRDVLGDGRMASVILLGLSVGAGYALHYAVERHFYARGSRGSQIPRRGFRLAVPSALCVLLAGSFAAYALNPEPMFNGRSQSEIIEESRVLTWKNLRAMDKDFTSDERPKVLIVGDSQAGDFVNLLLTAEPDAKSQIRTFPSTKACQIKLATSYYADREVQNHPDFKSLSSCRRDIEAFKEDTRIARTDVIVLAYAWTGPAARYLKQEVQLLAQLAPDAAIYVVGKKDFAASSFEYFEMTQSVAESDRLATEAVPLETTRFNESVAELLAEHFIDVQDLFCDMECQVFTDEGMPLLIDPRHFTRDALVALASEAEADEVLGPLIDDMEE